MSPSEQMLREQCRKLLPHAASLQFTSGSGAAKALQKRMSKLEQSSMVEARNAADRFEAECAAVDAALGTFDRVRKTGLAAVEQLELTNDLTLPHPVRHDRLLSIERLIVSFNGEAAKASEFLVKRISECEKALDDAAVHHRVSSRAHALAGFQDYDWETWADDIGARSAEQSAREASSRNKLIGVAIGLVIGAICVRIGWPMVRWSWAQTVDIGFGGVLVAIMLAALGAWLMARENSIGFIPLGLGALALIIVLLGPTIIVGAGLAGYFLANYAAGYLGSKDTERSADLAEEHGALIDRFLAYGEGNDQTSPQSLQILGEKLEKLSARRGEFEARVQRCAEVVENIRRRRELIYFGDVGFKDVCQLEDDAWRSFGRPIPIGYTSSDGLPVYPEGEPAAAAPQFLEPRDETLAGPDLPTRIEAACSRFMCSDFYVGDAIPEHKRMNALAYCPPGEQIIALVDATVLGSAVNGLAIGSEGIGWQNNEGGRQTFTWSQLRKKVLRPTRHSLNMGSDTVDLSGSGVRASLLKEILESVLMEIASELPERKGR